MQVREREGTSSAVQALAASATLHHILHDIIDNKICYSHVSNPSILPAHGGGLGGGGGDTGSIIV